MMSANSVVLEHRSIAYKVFIFPYLFARYYEHYFIDSGVCLFDNYAIVHGREKKLVDRRSRKVV
jgi:hypothetical protein